MSVTEYNDGKRVVIDEYSLKEFVDTIQEYVLKGYVIGSANEDYPQGFSGHFSVGMEFVRAPAPAIMIGAPFEDVASAVVDVVKEGENVVQPEETLVEKSTKPATTTRGRKPSR